LIAETETKTRDDAAEQGERGERQHDERGARSAQGLQRGRENVTGTVLRGAALGGAAGVAIGAWAALAKTRWPEEIGQVTRAVTEAVRDVGRTAACAAAQTVEPAAVAALLPGNDDRTEVVKRAARDAATAATRAARDAISTLSEGANGSKGARNRAKGD
jgi:hypothetical protein